MARVPLHHKRKCADEIMPGCTAGQSDGDTLRELVAQLSRVQELANAWLAADEQQQLQYADGWSEHQAFNCGVASFADHVRDLALLTVRSFFLPRRLGSRCMCSCVTDIIQAVTRSSNDTRCVKLRANNGSPCCDACQCGNYSTRSESSCCCAIVPAGGHQC